MLEGDDRDTPTSRQEKRFSCSTNRGNRGPSRRAYRKTGESAWRALTQPPACFGLRPLSLLIASRLSPLASRLLQPHELVPAPVVGGDREGGDRAFARHDAYLELNVAEVAELGLARVADDRSRDVR